MAEGYCDCNECWFLKRCRVLARNQDPVICEGGQVDPVPAAAIRERVLPALLGGLRRFQPKTAAEVAFMTRISQAGLVDEKVLATQYRKLVYYQANARTKQLEEYLHGR